jgi:hypothetical protein
MKPPVWSNKWTVGAIIAVMVSVYCGSYLFFRVDGTLTHYYSTGDGHRILRSHEYRHSEAVMLALTDPTAASAFKESNARFLDSVEIVFVPLRFIEAHLHRDPVLAAP